VRPPPSRCRPATAAVSGAGGLVRARGEAPVREAAQLGREPGQRPAAAAGGGGVGAAVAGGGEGVEWGRGQAEAAGAQAGVEGVAGGGEEEEEDEDDQEDPARVRGSGVSCVGLRWDGRWVMGGCGLPAADAAVVVVVVVGVCHHGELVRMSVVVESRVQMETRLRD